MSRLKMLLNGLILLSLLHLQRVSCSATTTKFLDKHVVGEHAPGVRVDAGELAKSLARLEDLHTQCAKDKPPVPYVVGKARVKGTVQKMSASSQTALMEINFPVYTIGDTDSWTAVPLLSSTAVLQDYTMRPVTRPEPAADSEAETKANKCGVEGQDMFLLSKKDYFVLLVKGGNCAVDVTLKVLAPIKLEKLNRRARKARVGLALPLESPSSEVEVTIPGFRANGDRQRRVWDVGVPTAHRSDMSVIHSLVVNNDNSTTVRALVRQSTFHLRWNTPTVTAGSLGDQAEEEEKDPDKLEFHVEQTVRGFLGNGMLTTKFVGAYEVTSGEMDRVEIIVPAGHKVVDVSGDIDTWTTKASGTEEATRLLVRRSSPTLPTFVVKVTAERPVNTTKSQVALVGFESVGARREHGQLGLYRLTTLDVKIASMERATRIDVSEASTNITGREGLICVVKYSSPKHSILVDVQRHERVEIVTCLIEESWFTATVTDEGTLFRSTFSVKNMDKAFLELRSADADKTPIDVWSAHVDNKPVHPASDHPGHLMIPLQTRHSFYAQEIVQSVEIVYFSPDIKINSTPGHHTLSLRALTPDVPSMQQHTTVYMPENKRYLYYHDDLALLKPCDQRISLPHARHHEHWEHENTASSIPQGRYMNFASTNTATAAPDLLTDELSFKSKGTLSVKVPALTTARVFCHNAILSLKPSNTTLKIEYHVLDPNGWQVLALQVMDRILDGRAPVWMAVSVLLACVFLCCACRRKPATAAVPTDGRATDAE